jgi:hypothetical protein
MERSTHVFTTATSRFVYKFLCLTIKVSCTVKPAIRHLKQEAICANSPQALPCKKLWPNIRFDSVVKEVVPSFPAVPLHYWQLNQEQAGGVG